MLRSGPAAAGENREKAWKNAVCWGGGEMGTCQQVHFPSCNYPITPIPHHPNSPFLHDPLRNRSVLSWETFLRSARGSEFSSPTSLSIELRRSSSMARALGG